MSVRLLQGNKQALSACDVLYVVNEFADKRVHGLAQVVLVLTWLLVRVQAKRSVVCSWLQVCLTLMTRLKCPLVEQASHSKNESRHLT